MANEIDALLARVDDSALRGDLKTQFDRLRQKRQFGLVFEEHLPERVTLPHHPIRRGTKVVARDDEGAEPRVVVAINSELATLPTDDGGTEDLFTESLVAVAEFGEPIYPGLKRLGSVDRGGDKPAHVVIKGENHHALEALQFTHAGKVDCIYIDPPYNTGARDWKYNNDYVDGDDAYRHSKWLAFMKRRLLLAKDLLNPEDSVLIVTIDEKEHLRLGLLLEQLFPGSKVQMVTIVINAPGQARRQELARVNEFAFFVFLGTATPAPGIDDLLNEKPSGNPNLIRWESLLRSGTNSRRRDRPALFYPVFINSESGAIAGAGDSKPETATLDEWTTPDGAVAIWPLKSDGTQGNWRASPEYLRELVTGGYAKAGGFDAAEGRGTVWYLGKSAIKKVGTGEIEVVGRDDQGALVVQPAEGAKGTRRTIAKTVWNRPSHHAGWHGSALLRNLLPDRQFPFPKSLYVVEDALRVAAGSKNRAVILDFFAGSGTTAHAVARLNRQEGTQHQSVVVTNNEVSPDDAASLEADNVLRGSSQWEALGIFEHITRPRIEAAITGVTPGGKAVKGAYKFTDEFPMAEGFSENVEFVELTYLDAEDIELDTAFAGIAPLLWMRAGSCGPIIEDRTDADREAVPYSATDVYAVLFEPDQWRPFLDELPDTVTTVFVVTDSASVFAGVAGELPDGLDVVRLYENYLTTFAINQGGRR